MNCPTGSRRRISSTTRSNSRSPASRAPSTITATWRGKTNSKSHINNQCRRMAPLCQAQHFLRICTHIQTTPISNDLCPSMSTHSMTCVNPLPTQNPWAWVGMGMGTQCRALVKLHEEKTLCDYGKPSVFILHLRTRLLYPHWFWLPFSYCHTYDLLTIFLFFVCALD